MDNIKIGLRKIKFGNKEVNKKEFYSSKQAISLDSVDLNKIVVSKKWKINDTTYKHICGYLNNDSTIDLNHLNYSTIMCYFTSNEWMY